MRWAVLGLALLLGGCFSSNGPVFEEARGDCPFTTPTTLTEVNDGEAHHYVFVRDGGYCKATSDDPTEEAERVLFVPIGDDWWILQGDEAKPTYSMMHRIGAEAQTFLPQCDDFSARRLRRLHVTYDEGRSSCTVTNAHQVETLFRAWRSPERRPAGVYRLD